MEHATQEATLITQTNTVNIVTRLLKVRKPVSWVRRLERKLPPLRESRTPERDCPSSALIWVEGGKRHQDGGRVKSHEVNRRYRWKSDSPD